MRITILALGTRGDVEPYLALGLGLQASGYQVCMAVPTNFDSVVQQHGLGYRPLGIDMPDLIRSDIGQLALGSDHRYLRFLGYLREMAAPLAQRLLQDMWTACQGDTRKSVSMRNLSVSCKFRRDDPVGRLYGGWVISEVWGDGRVAAGHLRDRGRRPGCSLPSCSAGRQT